MQPPSPEPVRLSLGFSPTPGGALVRWESDLIGTRISTFANPFSSPTWRVLIRALDQAQALSSPLLPSETDQLIAIGMADQDRNVCEDLPRRIGRSLYQALISDPQGARTLDTLRNGAAALGQPIAWRLLFPPAAVALAALPWELLWDDGPTPVILSRGRAASFSRHLDLDEAIPPSAPTSRRTLRILALTPQADVNESRAAQRIDAQHTLWERLRATGQAEITELSPVTRRDLVDALQIGDPPDVLHFTGHGHYHHGLGYLMIDRIGSRWDKLTADQLVALCGGVRMIVLNACQGAKVEPDDSLHTAIAPALSAAGVPIVIGLQMTIRAASANRAAEVIYRAINAGRSVQDAVSMVRQALYVEEPERSAWYVPTLYIRSRDMRALYV